MNQNWAFQLQVRVTLGTPLRVTPSATLTKVKASAMEELHGEGVETAAPSGIAYLDKFTPSSLLAQSFEYSTALSLALAARLAYEPEEVVKETVIKKWLMKTCDFVNQDDTQCFVATNPEAVLISFRGTESVGDWMANLNLVSTTRSYGAVHRGFLSAFQAVQEKLESLLAPNKGRPVILTGHSLGGALALIAAAEWQGKRHVSCIHTCGQPAVGMRDFQRFMEEQYGDEYFRFVNDDDVVPMVPPFYKHAGRLIHFAADGGLESALESPELEALGIDLGAVMEDTPMLTLEQFNLMRAQLLQESAERGAGTLSGASVEAALQTAVVATGQPGLESLEGIFPSISDHSMDLYLAKIAHYAGVGG